MWSPKLIPATIEILTERTIASTKTLFRPYLPLTNAVKAGNPYELEWSILKQVWRLYENGGSSSRKWSEPIRQEAQILIALGFPSAPKSDLAKGGTQPALSIH